MSLRPLNDQVLVQKHPAGRLTASGIEIPTEKQDTGTVLAVGPGRLLKDGSRLPMSVRPGDTVLFGQYAGATVRKDVRWVRPAPDQLVMPEDHIMGVIES